MLRFRLQALEEQRQQLSRGILQSRLRQRRPDWRGHAGSPSLSSRKRRSSPVESLTGFSPPFAASSRLPQPASPGPERVPVPIRSPGRRLQPLQVWCASICATVQYMWRVLLTLRRCGGKPFSLSPCVSNNTSSSMSKAPSRWSASFRKYGSGAGSPSRRSGWGIRNGMSASGVTTQGDTVEAKFLARKGPRGWYSHAWMSRADQSFKRQKPATCAVARSIGMGSPSALPGPIHTPSSSS